MESTLNESLQELLMAVRELRQDMEEVKEILEEMTTDL